LLQKSQENFMDPSQEEDLKKLSNRTEELLSRLNDLSSTLNNQFKSQVPPPNQPTSEVVAQSGNAMPPDLIIKKDQEKITDSRNLYSIPINTHYLEKSEKSIKTTDAGQHFMTTSSTSIFTEHQFLPNSEEKTSTPLSNESFVPAQFPSQPQEQFHVPQSQAQNPFNSIPAKPKENFQPAQEPSHQVNQDASFLNNLHQATRRVQPKPSQPSEEAKPGSKYFQRAHNQFSPSPTDYLQSRPGLKQEEAYYPVSALADPLQPSAIFSADQAQTRRAPIGRKVTEDYKPEVKPSNRVVERLSNQSKDLQDRLKKYSNKVSITENGDVLRLFAIAAPFFSFFGAVGIINALGISIDDFPKMTSICCICLFLGIFLSVIAMRIVEMSELLRWAHNQILSIQSVLDEQKNKNSRE
jgi:hypothetical protein